MDPNIGRIKVILRDKQGKKIEKDLVAISSFNEIGQFDILFNHANFVSKIEKKIIFHHSFSKKEEMEIEDGIISAKENSVEIFIGI